MHYCQDGLQVYFATETQQYTYASIYGHYELQPNVVNGRPYFKKSLLGLWYDGNGYWWIGLSDNKGQSFGFAAYEKDVFCPHQLYEREWLLWDDVDWKYAENDLVTTCKCTQGTLMKILRHN